MHTWFHVQLDEKSWTDSSWHVGILRIGDGTFWPIVGFFLFLGDEIPKQDVLNLLNELAPKEDEEGFIPYMPFLEKLCGKK